MQDTYLWSLLYYMHIAISILTIAIFNKLLESTYLWPHWHRCIIYGWVFPILILKLAVYVMIECLVIFGKSNIKLNMIISTYQCLSSKHIIIFCDLSKQHTYYAKLKCLYTSWNFVLFKLVIAVMRTCACVLTCIWVQYVYVFNHMHSYSFIQTHSFINLITMHLCYNLPIQA